jgi:hypothetical protein
LEKMGRRDFNRSSPSDHAFCEFR